VTLGAFPGHAVGPDIEPTRYSAMHEWHAEHGARFVNAGMWKRPHSYPRDGESADDAANREAKNVRRNVGVVDVSTLGKIELQGPRRRGAPESRVHQPLGHAQRRPLPLRRDAARRRHGSRRRDDVAASRRRTT
jgi:sarcosine oxidase subunit alpha